MGKGYLLIAHTKIEYLQMAFNLAVSMKHAGTKHPIALITNLDLKNLKDSSNTVAPSVFDKVLSFPENLKPFIRPFPFYIKTRLPEFTPWDETIYLDVDALFLKNPDFIFDKYTDFGIIVNWKRPATEGWERKTWAPPNKLFAHYGFDPSGFFFDTNSSLIYFGKNKLSEDIFRLAEKYYAEDFYPEYHHEGFGHYPDELAFNTALAELQPELEKNQPFSFIHADSKDAHGELARALQANCIGLYGNETVTHSFLYRTYNRLIVEQGRAYHKYYGFKLNPKSKAANGSAKRPRYEGIERRIEA